MERQPTAPGYERKCLGMGQRLVVRKLLFSLVFPKSNWAGNGHVTGGARWLMVRRKLARPTVDPQSAHAIFLSHALGRIPLCGFGTTVNKNLLPIGCQNHPKGRCATSQNLLCFYQRQIGG